jgi:hypothetical protein
MSSRHTSRPAKAAATRSLALLLTAVAAGAMISGARAEGAEKILKAMSDYMTSQKSISISFDTDTEVVTSDLQKIQFSSSGQALLSRPDKLRITRTGGYTDVEVVFDGKTMSFIGKHLNSFAQKEVPGNVDQLIAGIRDRDNITLPGADLLLTRVYDELMAEVTEAKHVGQGVIDGVECEHLAFRTPEVDWQLWVETGARPVPRKYVITSKHVAGAPQYVLRIKEWKSDAPTTAEAFAFKAPPDAKRVEISALVDIDEVPTGQVIGAKK